MSAKNPVRAGLAAGLLQFGLPVAAMAAEEGGLPQLKQIHTFPSQIFWLIVTFGFLYWMMKRYILPRITEVLEQRRDKIDDDLVRAEKVKAEAEAVLATYERSMAEAREQAGQRLRAASDEAKAEAARRLDTFAKELSARTAEAEAGISRAKEAAMQEIAAVATGSAASVTEKLIGIQPDQQAAEAAVRSAQGGRG